MMDRRNIIVSAIVALVFVAGAAAGLAATHVMAPRRILGTRVKHDMSGVLDRLQLSPDQRTRAEDILARSAPRAESVMVEMAERLRAISDSVDGELRGILDPTQRVRLDSLRRERPVMIKRKMVSPDGRTSVDSVVLPNRDRR